MLEPTPHLVTTEQLAAKLRVSTQMVGKYEDEGIITPEPVRAGKGRGKRWDLDTCLAQIASNKKQASKHGGKRMREGKLLGGRKRKTEKDQPLAKPFSDAVTVETIITRAGPPENALTVLDTLKVRPDELEALCKYAAHIGLTVAHVDLMRAVQSAQETAIRIEEKRRTLISASEVKLTFGLALAQVRSKLEELPSSVSSSAATSLQLTPDQQGSLRVIVDALVRGTLQMLASEMDQNLRKLVNPEARESDVERTA